MTTDYSFMAKAVLTFCKIEHRNEDADEPLIFSCAFNIDADDMVNNVVPAIEAMERSHPDKQLKIVKLTDLDEKYRDITDKLYPQYTYKKNGKSNMEWFKPTDINGDAVDPHSIRSGDLVYFKGRFATNNHKQGKKYIGMYVDKLAVLQREAFEFELELEDDGFKDALANYKSANESVKTDELAKKWQ